MLDIVIKMNLALFGFVCLFAFAVLIATIMGTCIDFLQQYMNTHIAILVVVVAVIELVIFGLSFAKYLIGG